MEATPEMNDGFLRCKKCKPHGSDMGTILCKVEISIARKDQPYIPISSMIRCPLCGWVERVYLLPGSKDLATGKTGPSNAEQAGLSLRHVAECVRQAPLSSYTIDELKSGKLRGFPVKPPESNYNPDQFTEPEAVF